MSSIPSPNPETRGDSSSDRQPFGIAGLDDLLGGGLRPGTLTVVAGATGAGKTQLGLAWANHGLVREGARGVLYDLTSRGDAQNHQDYADRHFGWTLEPFPVDPSPPPPPEAIWEDAWPTGDLFQPFGQTGRRVTRQDLDAEQWHAWKSDLARILRGAVGFLYGHLIRGARRVVFDGIEPAERFADSIQFELFEYLYHQAIRRPSDLVAQEWFRERFRANQERVLARSYPSEQVGCLYLYTTPEVMLDDLIARPLGSGDIFAGANTIVLMGRTRDPSAPGQIGRGLYVAKHRGSACQDQVRPYRLTASGLEVLG